LQKSYLSTQNLKLLQCQKCSKSKFDPLLVDGDIHGNSLFDENNKQIAKGFDKLYEGLKKPALSRYGETDDRKDELI